MINTSKPAAFYFPAKAAAPSFPWEIILDREGDHFLIQN